MGSKKSTCSECGEIVTTDHHLKETIEKSLKINISEREQYFIEIITLHLSALRNKNGDEFVTDFLTAVMNDPDPTRVDYNYYDEMH